MLYTSPVMILLLLVLFVVAACSWGGDGPCKNSIAPSTGRRLKEDLLCNYDRDARPVKNSTNGTTVLMNMFPVLIDLDELFSKLEIHIWLQLVWKDEFLTWNPDDYDGKKYIVMEGSDIWVPNLIDFKSHGNSNDLLMERKTAIVFNTGKVTLTFMTQFTAHCKMDVRYWPNDRHTCGSMIGSKTYLGPALDLTINSNSVSLIFFKGSRKWKLESATLIRKVAELNASFFVTLDYNFTVKRHSKTHISTTVLPLIGAVVLTLISFWQHPLELPRIVTLVVSLIGHFFIVEQLSWLVPVNGETSVLILDLVAYSLLICAFSLMLPVAYRNSFVDKPLPIWLSNLRLKVNNSNAAWLFFLTAPQQPVGQASASDEEAIINTSPKYRQDWLIIANILDRLIFYILMLVYIIMFASCLSN
ncbi:neuronal acetylcholine receptor subunit alpha-5-like [Rhodnius prolixus]|uniref:neuronal acetylcholine receptor subunit alpha-5-like n=1 Tax=Rhodnius prolixus TaxID=13249 RepID=UPI003D187F7A